MPQFYFRHLQSPSSTDDKPCELSGLAEALAEANLRARRIVAHHALRGEKVRGSVDVENERHAIVARVMLAEMARQIA